MFFRGCDKHNTTPSCYAVLGTKLPAAHPALVAPFLPNFEAWL